MGFGIVVTKTQCQSDETHCVDFCKSMGFGIFVTKTQCQYQPEFQIPDFISFIRAGNPVFGPKMGIGNRGFGCLVRTTQGGLNFC